LFLKASKQAKAISNESHPTFVGVVKLTPNLGRKRNIYREKIFLSQKNRRKKLLLRQHRKRNNP
jgi:hypothetical protein